MSTLELEPKKAQFELSVDSRLLAQRLRDLTEGEIIPYPDLSCLIDRNVQKDGRSYLDTARQYVLREYSIVTEIVRGAGVKRLENGAIPAAVSSNTANKMRKLTTRAKNRLDAVDYDRLNLDERIQYNASLSLLGMMKIAASEKANQELQNTVRSNQGAALPSASVLELFRKV